MRMTIQARECATVLVERFGRHRSLSSEDPVAVEEPLEIQLTYGKRDERRVKPISITMRTPGNDAELAVGFLHGEGVIREIDEIERISSSDKLEGKAHGPTQQHWQAVNAVRVELAPEIELNLATLQRNFYTTSSCGVCGKASLLALRATCPPRVEHNFRMEERILYSLHERLRSVQQVFRQTGGIHSAALFDAEGVLVRVREDVGRHNALDKLLGAALLEDELPLRDRFLLLSGRTSFELIQKAVMAGIPMVAAFGAPSSLAISLAREFDITLIGFLAEDRFNAYHGAQRLRRT